MQDKKGRFRDNVAKEIGSSSDNWGSETGSSSDNGANEASSSNSNIYGGECRRDGREGWEGAAAREQLERELAGLTFTEAMEERVMEGLRPLPSSYSSPHKWWNRQLALPIPAAVAGVLLTIGAAALLAGWANSLTGTQWGNTREYANASQSLGGGHSQSELGQETVYVALESGWFEREALVLPGKAENEAESEAETEAENKQEKEAGGDGAD